MLRAIQSRVFRLFMLCLVAVGVLVGPGAQPVNANPTLCLYYLQQYDYWDSQYSYAVEEYGYCNNSQCENYWTIQMNRAMYEMGQAGNLADYNCNEDP